MKLIRTIQDKFRFSMLVAVGLTLIVTTLLIVFEMWQIGEVVARSLAMLHAENVVKSIESQIEKDITLSRYGAKSEAVKRWLENPNNEDYKHEAFDVFMEINHLLSDSEVFVAVDQDKSMYFTTENMAYEDFKTAGVLSSALKSDEWYYQSRDSKADFSLNVDEDRFLSERKVWINAKVEGGTKAIGVVGTGINLKSVVRLLNEGNLGADVKILVVNDKGKVQIDRNMIDSGVSNNQAQSVAQILKWGNYNTAFHSFVSSGQPMKLINIKNSPYQYAAMSRIENTNWYVVTAYSLWALLEPKYYLPILLWMIAEVLLLGWVSTRIVAHHFVQPLEKLITSVGLKEVSGSYPIYGMNRDDEFGVLAQSIEQMSDRFVRAVPVGLFILDANSKFTYVNPYFCNQFNYADDEAFLTAFREDPYRFFKNPNDLERIREDTAAGKHLISYEIEFFDAIGRCFWGEVKLNLVEKNGIRVQYEGMLLNIQHKKEYENRLINMALTDPLTGLYNRYYLDKIIFEETSNSDRNDVALSMVIFDLDHFKRVNDNFGHDVGDFILTSVTALVKQMLRRDEILFRWGGEEFAILLKTSGEHAFEVAERLRKQIEAHDFQPVGSVTSSFGVAQRMAYEPYTEWFKRMDEALIDAKESGRNQTKMAKQGATSNSLLKLIWKDEFLSGNSTIDAQHHMLFELANQLMESCASPDKKDGVMDEYRNIAVHITKHLHDEIDILAELGYDAEKLRLHQEAHDELLEHMTEISKRLEFLEIKPTDALLKIIDEIVVDHMLHMDTEFYSFIKRSN